MLSLRIALFRTAGSLTHSKSVRTSEAFACLNEITQAISHTTLKASAAATPTVAPRANAVAFTASIDRVCGHCRISAEYSFSASSFASRCSPTSTNTVGRKRGLKESNAQSVEDRTSKPQTERSFEFGVGLVATRTASNVRR